MQAKSRVASKDKQVQLPTYCSRHFPLISWLTQKQVQLPTYMFSSFSSRLAPGVGGGPPSHLASSQLPLAAAKPRRCRGRPRRRPWMPLLPCRTVSSVEKEHARSATGRGPLPRGLARHRPPRGGGTSGVTPRPTSVWTDLCKRPRPPRPLAEAPRRRAPRHRAGRGAQPLEIRRGTGWRAENPPGVHSVGRRSAGVTRCPLEICRGGPGYGWRSADFGRNQQIFWF